MGVKRHKLITKRTRESFQGKSELFTQMGQGCGPFDQNAVCLLGGKGRLHQGGSLPSVQQALHDPCGGFEMADTGK